jgi:2-polyprenyl-3-methyl-5-hydroxy-6-metoxy-1,4-benzoquinol methylase
MSELERLEATYRDHHEAERTPDFVFGGDERARVFRELVGGPGRRVLDLGCRYGALTRTYSGGNDVVGVDVDREALAVAEAELGIATRWADVEQPLDFADESFDVVVAGELIEHVRDPSRLAAEAFRVLRPGGRVVGSVPNAFRLKSRLLFLMGRKPEDNPTHLHLFTPDDLRTLLSAFEQVELRYLSSRWLRLHPRLTANIVVFTGVKP